MRGSKVMGRWLHRYRRGWVRGLGFRHTGGGGGTNWGGRGFGRDNPDRLSDLLLERTARAGLHGHRDEARKNFESSRERGGRGLGAQQGRQSIRWFAARAGGNDVVDGLLEFVAIALNALEVVAERASNS